MWTPRNASSTSGWFSDYSDDDCDDRKQGGDQNNVKSCGVVLTVGSGYDSILDGPKFIHSDEEKLPQVVIVLGPPGAGKGTQCKKVEKKFPSYVHFSTGDKMREAAEAGDELGQKVKSYIDDGQFVPDDVITEVVRAFVLKAGAEGKTVLLDGFPRTPKQAYDLQEIAHVACVLHLTLADHICMERIANRCYDPATGEVYSVDDVPDEVKDTRRRPLDLKPEKVDLRLKIHHKMVGFILKYYDGRIQTVDAKGSRDKVLTRVTNTLQNFKEIDPVFCITCEKRVADYMNMPCGHKRWCNKCAPKLSSGDENGPECNVDSCKEEITSYIRMSRYISEEKDDDEDAGFTLSHSLCSLNDTSASVCVKVNVPDVLERPPINLAFVIDVSGSMGSQATYENDKGVTVDAGCDVLTIVKHALKTVLHYLKDQDSFGLVLFTDNARVSMPLTKMTPENIAIAREKVNSMRPENSTNIWAGLELGMNMFKGVDGINAVMLLTDGEPNLGHFCDEHDRRCPDRKNGGPCGPFLVKDYLAANSDISCEVHTFGFGIKLKKNLLSSIAEFGGGTYTFLPDSATVGPSFVKTMAGIGSTAAQHVELQVTLKNGATFEKDPVQGIFPGDLAKTNKNTLTIKLGSLLYGQSRDVVVKINLPDGTKLSKGDNMFKKPYMQACLLVNKGIAAVEECKSGVITSEAIVALARSEVVKQIALAMNDEARAIISINMLIDDLKSMEKSHFFITTLLDEVKTRVLKAVQPGKKWGPPYLGALKRAHERQVSNNIMDKSTSIYGGTLYQAIVAYCRPIYVEFSKEVAKIAPPQQPKTVVPASTTATHNAPVSYSWGGGGGGGGCIGGDCVVQTPSGALKVKDVKRGDYLPTGEGTFAKVLHAIRIKQETDVVVLSDGLVITPTHPILLSSWVHPKDLAVGTMKCDEVYNFVLESTHTVEVNGIRCITWGHDSTDPAIKHGFYGSSEAIEKALSGFPERDVITVNGFKRDAQDHAFGFI